MEFLLNGLFPVFSRFVPSFIPDFFFGKFDYVLRPFPFSAIHRRRRRRREYTGKKGRK